MSDLQCPARLYVVWPSAGDDAAALVPPGERMAAVYERPDDLASVADLHRGEAVLVVVDAALPETPDLAPGDVVGLELDGDGWRRLPS